MRFASDRAARPVDQTGTAGYEDRVPRVQEVDGRPTWVVDGATLGSLERRRHRPARKEVRFRVHGRLGIDRIHQAASTEGRIEVLDESGIWPGAVP